MKLIISFISNILTLFVWKSNVDILSYVVNLVILFRSSEAMLIARETCTKAGLFVGPIVSLNNHMHVYAISWRIFSAL